MHEDAKFDRLITPILNWETGGDMVGGGWNNDPRDLGGPTQWGLASNYQAPEIAKLIVEKRLPLSRAKEIYYTNYYLGSGASDLPDPIAFIVLDHYVHGTTRRVAEGWQNFLSKVHTPIVADGVVGPETKGALRTLPRQLWVAFIAVDYTAYIMTLRETVADIMVEQRRQGRPVGNYRSNFLERAGRRLQLARSLI